MRSGWATLPLLIGLALTLGACGKQGAPEPAAAPAPSAPASVAGSARPAAAHDKPGAPDAGQHAAIARLNEDGSETVDESTGDGGTHNPLLAAVASTVSAATTAAAAADATPAPWTDGVNYTRLVPAQPTAVPSGQVEVLEFFWYACPHCYALEPAVLAWLKSKPAYITFVRVPVLWDEGDRSLARLYYTLESMGKLEQYHAAVFREIHVNKNPLIGTDPENTADAERIQLAFIRRLGLSDSDFETAYHSFEVNQKDMPRADELVQRYRVTAVPTFVINGKYITDEYAAGSQEKLISLVNYLAAQERKH